MLVLTENFSLPDFSFSAYFISSSFPSYFFFFLCCFGPLFLLFSVPCWWHFMRAFFHSAMSPVFYLLDGMGRPPSHPAFYHTFREFSFLTGAVQDHAVSIVDGTALRLSRTFSLSTRLSDGIEVSVQSRPWLPTRTFGRRPSSSP